MGLTFEEFVAAERKTGCKVCDALPMDMLAKVKELLREGQPLQTVARWVRSHGFSIGFTTFRTHKERCIG